MFVNSILFLAALSLSSCANIDFKERDLSEEEIKKYNLSGVLQEAEICPNRFDENLKQLVVDGSCEIVSCSVIDEKTICRAKKK